MKQKIIIIFLSIIITGFLINNLNAQQNRITIREFNDLKTYLTKIWIVVQKFDNAQAIDLMTQAKQEMDMAEDLIFNQNKYIQARLHMIKARTLGNRAAKIVLNQPVKRLRKQLDDMIDKAENNQLVMQTDESRYLLHQARRFRDFAYNAMEKGKFNKAQEYYRISFYFAEKSLNLAKRNGQTIDSQIAELKSNIDLLIIQAEESVLSKNDNKYQNLLNEAKRHYIEAINLLDTGRNNAAFTKLRLIEKLLYRLIDQLNRTSMNKDERMANDLYSTKAFIEALENEARENGNHRVDIFLNRAKLQYNEAEKAFESGKWHIAKSKLNLCQRFASKVLRLLKSAPESEVPDILSKITNNKRLLEFQKTAIQESGNRVLSSMYKEAERLTGKAEELNKQQKYRAALRNLHLSTRILNKIQRNLDYDLNTKISETNEIQTKLNRVKELLNKLENNDQIPLEFQSAIQQLQNMYLDAEKNFSNEEYQIAAEYADFILQQINRQSKKWSQQTK